jgi:hypothetical protein
MKVLAVALGIIFLILAVLTFTGAVHALPAIGLDGKHHTKHTVLFFVIALLCFVWARMSAEPSTAHR